MISVAAAMGPWHRPRVAAPLDLCRERLATALRESGMLPGFTWDRQRRLFVRPEGAFEHHIGLEVGRRPGSTVFVRARVGGGLRFQAVESLLSELWPRHPTPESTLVAPGEKLGIRWHPLGSPDDAPEVARSMAVDIAELLDWLGAHARIEAIDEAFNHDPVPAHGLAANGRSPHERNRGLVAAFLLGRDLGELAARRRNEVAFQGPRFAVAELEALLARLGVPRA